MAFTQLRITGPAQARYELGAPMHVHDRSIHLGTLEPVLVTASGTEVHIVRFLPSAFVRCERRNFGPLVLLEVTAFIAEHFLAVQTVRFSLTREIETYGDGMKVASERSVLLQRMGADGITVSPQPDSAMPGNFVVQGRWSYNERNLEALGECLHREREIYRDLERSAGPAAAPPGWWRRLRQWLAGEAPR